ncbi:MAG: hypothetical protein AAGH88_04210 [Planctomycetota bacterium]
MKPLTAPAFCIFLILTMGCSSSPDAMSFDASDLPNGTGERVFTYENGAIMLREDYVAGTLERSRWFKPNGELIQQTDWVNGGGEGLFLNQDGSIRIRMPFKNGLAHGPAVFYNSSGGIAEVVFYENGQRADY